MNRDFDRVGARARHTLAAERDEDPRKAIHLRQVVAVRQALLLGVRPSDRARRAS